MARSSRKNNRVGLPDLPDGWSTREDLARIVAPGTDVDEWVKSVFLPGGWQLTNVGMDIMSRAYNSYVNEHANNSYMTGKVLINMGRITNGPWHARGHRIWTFNQDMHFELAMFDGDVRRFVDFYVPKTTG